MTTLLSYTDIHVKVSAWQRLTPGMTATGWISVMRKAGRESRAASARGKRRSSGDTQHFSRTGITAVFRPYSWKDNP